MTRDELLAILEDLLPYGAVVQIHDSDSGLDCDIKFWAIEIRPGSVARIVLGRERFHS